VARRAALDRETEVRILPRQYEAHSPKRVSFWLLSGIPSVRDANICSITDGTKKRILKLLEAGWRRRAISAEVGVSPSTVTRWARIFGFADVAPRPSLTDWAAVKEYYDAGHTIDECRAKFGFSYGAWDKAVNRGDVVPRPRADRELSHSTRDQVEDLLARGLSQAEISRELGLTKSTVAYHLRCLGVRADPRFARRHDWAAVQSAIDEEDLSMA
jgi:transcriptional regulator with XRE-family HTH domain